MPTPSPEIVELLTTFAVALSAPTLAKLLVLIYGAILAPGRRTVTAALRVQGRDQEPNFLVVLMAKVLHPENLPLPQASWYPKDEATFSDALAAVRRHLGGGDNYTLSPSDPDLCLIPRALWERLQQLARYAT